MSSALFDKNFSTIINKRVLEAQAAFIGKKFGLLTVERAAPSLNGIRVWCICDCGKKVLKQAAYLKKNRLHSCGCAQALGTPLSDYIGRKFGTLTVQDEATNLNGRRVWCACDCGKRIVIAVRHLKANSKRTCGDCFMRGD